MPLFDHFDILAPLYDRLIHPPEGDQLAEIAGLPVSGRLLDAGGGTGRIAQQLTGMASRVVVIDTSHNMLRQALSKTDLLVVEGEVEQLPFHDHSFECIVVVDAFHHLLDQERSLAELWRVLAKGGRIVIEEPDIRRFSVLLIALAEKLALLRSHFVSGERIADQLENLGARTAIHRLSNTVWVLGEK